VVGDGGRLLDAAALVAGQNCGHENRGRDEERHCVEPPGVQRRCRQCRGETESGAAAGGEVAHRGRAVLCRLAGIPPCRRMEHGNAESGEDQQREHRSVRVKQPGAAGADTSQQDSKRCHPPQRTAVGDQADQQLRDGTADRRGQRQAGRGGIAVVALQDEERDRRGHDALIQVVDGVCGEPDPHPLPLRHPGALDPGHEVLGGLQFLGVEMEFAHGFNVRPQGDPGFRYSG
jgi:hypothetical protein